MTTTQTAPLMVDDDPVPVDQVPDHEVTAFTRITAEREGAKNPVIVDWLRDRADRNAIVRWAVGYAWHQTKYHGIRAPLIYYPKLLMYAPRGAGRAGRWLWRWAWDADAKPLRNSSIDRDSKKDYLDLKKDWKLTVHNRWRGLALAAVGLLIVIGLWWWLTPRLLLLPGWGPFADWVLTPWWTLILLGCAAVFPLGCIGRDPKKPLLSKATTPAHLAPVLRQEVVEAALRKLSFIRKDQVIEFRDPIIRDGPGWLARVHVPGVAPAKIVEERSALASGLDRPLNCVHPESGAHESGSLVKLWVGFQDISKMRMPAYPLLKGTADLFKPLPYGVDIRGQKVGISLFENNVLIGSLPGAGKTNVTRVLGIGAALDVTVELHVWEFSGKGDLGSLEKVAHRYGSGLSNEVFAACIADLEEIKANMEVRAAELSRLGKESPESCPDGKTSRYLANKAALGLHPMVVILDEVHNLYQHEIYGADARRLVAHIIRLGRGFGVILIQATQRPDKDSLPTLIRAIAGIRICLRVTDYDTADMILSSGARQSGADAHLLRPARLNYDGVLTDPGDVGVGYLDGVDPSVMQAKSYYLDRLAADRLCDRARKLREEAGRLTGYAAGVLDDKPDDSLLYDLLADIKRVIIEADRDWMHSQEILLGLAELREGHYSAWDQELLARNLTPLGVKTDQINRVCPDGARRNLRGVELRHVVRAIEARSGNNVVPLRVAPSPATGNTAV